MLMDTMEPQGDGYSNVRRLLTSLPVLQGLDPADQSALAANSTMISIRAGESLSPPGGLRQTFCFVVSGLLDVLGRSESENIVARLVPGDVFAEAAYQYP